MTDQLPITLHGAAKDSARTQFAALCWRMKRGRLQILLVTSRRRKRWIVPKGWPIEGKTPAECAATEAWEEAGALGEASNACVGVYSHARLREDEAMLPCLVMLYPVKIRTLKAKFPERQERRRKWVSVGKACQLVDELALQRLIRSFSPPKKVGSA